MNAFHNRVVRGFIASNSVRFPEAEQEHSEEAFGEVATESDEGS